MWFAKPVYLILTTLMLASCSENKTKGPDSTGRGSEIIVVGSKALWDGPVGEAIRSALTCNTEGLYENEPEYSLVFVSENKFSESMQSHHNVLILDINPEYKKDRVETLSNTWAYPQRVIKIKASSDTSFIRLFAEHSEAIKELFNQNERAIFTARNKLRRNTTVEKMLADDFGIRMVISKDFYQVKKITGFVWLRSGTNSDSLYLMIYTYPFKDTSEVNPDSVLAARSRYTKLFVAGPGVGQSDEMGRGVYKTISRKIIFKGMYALETRGLFKAKADSALHPFINYTVVDAPRQRIVVFDGSVYDPDKSNRNSIRQLESIIWGAEFNNLPMEVKN